MALQLTGVSIGEIPGKVTPDDIATVHGCHDVYLGLRNLKDLSEQLYVDYCNFFDRKDSRGLEKVAVIINKIEMECTGLFSEIEKVICHLKKS